MSDKSLCSECHSTLRHETPDGRCDECRAKLDGNEEGSYGAMWNRSVSRVVWHVVAVLAPLILFVGMMIMEAQRFDLIYRPLESRSITQTQTAPALSSPVPAPPPPRGELQIMTTAPQSKVKVNGNDMGTAEPGNNTPPVMAQPQQPAIQQPAPQVIPEPNPNAPNLTAKDFPGTTWEISPTDFGPVTVEMLADERANVSVLGNRFDGNWQVLENRVIVYAHIMGQTKNVAADIKGNTLVANGVTVKRIK